MDIDAPVRSNANKEATELSERLFRFREGLPAEHRQAMNNAIGGAIAVNRMSKRPDADKVDARSFSSSVATFAEGLPEIQRKALSVLLSQGALAWGLRSEPKPEGPTTIAHEADLVFLFGGALVRLVADLVEDDEEATVPVLDLPD